MIITTNVNYKNDRNAYDSYIVNDNTDNNNDSSNNNQPVTLIMTMTY